MAEQEMIFSSTMKFGGVFKFADFYKFCYDWLMEETQFDYINEKKYTEKIDGAGKKVEILWEGFRKMTDYFKFKIEIKFLALKLEKIEVNKGGIKEKTNKGTIELEVKGILIRDWQGKFEHNAWQKFLRSAYEKWIITSRIDQFETKVFKDCEEFVEQAKAYLAMEGKL